MAEPARTLTAARVMAGLERYAKTVGKSLRYGLYRCGRFGRRLFWRSPPVRLLARHLPISMRFKRAPYGLEMRDWYRKVV